MGTKNNPGDYDCYAKLEPDEPYFLLRGKDPAAPYLTMMWAASRRGDWNGMLDLVNAMVINKEINARVSHEEHSKLAESRQCALAMNEWRAQKLLPSAEGKTAMSGELTVNRGTDEG